MNKHYYFLLLFSSFILLRLPSATACGYAWVSDCSSQVHLRINGTLDSFNIADCPSGYRFDGLQLGNLQSLSLANAKAITWESCQNNVSGVQLRYRVYEQGFPGGSWLSLNLQEYHQTIEGPYTTRYRANAVNISLSDGLTIGKTYVVEVYLNADVDTIGDDNIPETTLLRNNNGANYKLTFTYGGPAAPAISLLPHLTPPSCNGYHDGIISVSTYGNLNGIFYYWSNIPLNFFAQYNLQAGIYTITVTNAQGQSAVQTMQLTEPAPLHATFSNIQSAGCNNSPGSATVLASGGTLPYQYLWQTGQQTSMATLPGSGNWAVTVTDAHQCSTTESVFIGSNGLVERTVSADICSGASYSIGGQTFTTAGTYTFTTPGTAGCDTLTHLTITLIEAASLLTSLPDSIVVSCAMPQINLCAATHPMAQYQWIKDGVSATNTPCLLATAGGHYQLNVMLGACSATTTVFAAEHLVAETAEVTGSFLLNCNGVPPNWLVVHTGAVNPFYSWVYDGAVISTNDSLFFQIIEFQGPNPVLPALTVTDGFGCVNAMPEVQVGFIQNNLPALIDISTTDASSPTAADGSASATITGGMPPYAIDWSNGATTPVITGLTPGSYCVTVVGSNGCSAVSCAVVSSAVATNTPVAKQLQLYPNPVSSGAWIEIALPVTMLGETLVTTLLDGQGEVLKSDISEPGRAPFLRIQMPALLPAGITFVQVRGETQVLSGKIIVR